MTKNCKIKRIIAAHDDQPCGAKTGEAMCTKDWDASRQKS